MTTMITNIDLQKDTKDNRRNSEGIEYIQKQYNDALNNADRWELDADTRYCEDDVLTIMGMLSYLENIERGFGHLNDEVLFKTEREADFNGVLYKEAVRGFSFSKKYICLRRRLKECKHAR